MDLCSCPHLTIYTVMLSSVKNLVTSEFRIPIRFFASLRLTALIGQMPCPYKIWLSECITLDSSLRGNDGNYFKVSQPLRRRCCSRSSCSSLSSSINSFRSLNDRYTDAKRTKATSSRSSSSRMIHSPISALLTSFSPSS